MIRRAIVVALLITAALAPVTAQRGRYEPDPFAAATLALAVDRLLADRWFPGIPRAKGDVPATDDELLLQNFLSSPNPHVRLLAVRSVGRFLNPLDAPYFRSQLGDREIGAEALFWLVRVLAYTEDPVKRRAAHKDLLDLLKALQGTTPVNVVFDTLSKLGGIDEPTAIDLEEKWAEEIDRHWPYADPDPQLQKAQIALQHIEPLLKLFPNRVLQSRTRLILGRVAHSGLLGKVAHPSLTALEALTHVKVTDRPLAQAMLNYRCPFAPGGEIPPPTCGWEYRRQGVLLIDARDASFATAIEDGLKDPSTVVRLELYRRIAATVEEAKTCAPFMSAFEDRSPVIQLEAFEWLLPACRERDEIVVRLKAQASDVGEEPEFRLAPIASRALLALARFSPDDVRKITEHMTASSAGWHAVWQYRAAAARASGVMRDEAFAIRFVTDPHTNVQFEALSALHGMASDARWPHALTALESDDYRLVHAGAALIRGFPDRDAMMHPLVAALERVTKEDKDTSRSARLEIIGRLKDIAPADSQGVVVLHFYANTLQRYLTDFDPAVANAIADVLGVVYGKRPQPRPQRRRIEQPTVTEIAGLPETAIIVFANPGDEVSIALNISEAPITVARFVKLANAKYYDGQIFYKLLPLNLVQAGSPRPNDLMGFGRFVRDEIGRQRHVFGQIGWSSQGPDAGDAQFYVNLMDVPGRDYRQTILGRVTLGHKGGIVLPGMDLIASDVIEGTRIKTIEFGKRRAPDQE